MLEFTAERSGYFHVFLGGVLDLPRHTTEREALEHATNLKFEYPNVAVHVDHGDYKVLLTLAAGGGAQTLPLNTTIVPDPGPGSPDYPNEPAGMTTVADVAFDSWMPAGITWDGYDESPNLAIVTYDSDSCVRVRYPNNYAGGYSPARFGRAGGGKKHIYCSLMHDLSAGWHYHPNSTVNKVWFCVDSALGGGNPFYLNCEKVGDGTHRYVMNFQGTARSPYSWIATPDVSVYHTPGDGLVQVEWHLIMNSPGTEDGEARLWVNDVLTTTITGEEFSGSADPKWTASKCDPIWGGGGGNKSQEDYQYIGHLYQSIKD